MLVLVVFVSSGNLRPFTLTLTDSLTSALTTDESKQVNRQIFAEIHCAVVINSHGLFLLCLRIAGVLGQVGGRVRPGTGEGVSWDR